MQTKEYLEYLNKEMTIMGILSGVSIAAPAGILHSVLSKDSPANLWDNGQVFIVIGSAFCILAAAYFYKQRSLLAWYYGQIALNGTLTSGKPLARLREWLRDADSWKTWISYSWAFTFLAAGFAQYFLVFVLVIAEPRWSWLSSHAHTVKPWAIAVSFIWCALTLPMQWHALSRYKFCDHYWKEWFSDSMRLIRGAQKLPHDGVYIRLMRSAIHGVGVFAIRDIPAGTYVFAPDDDRIVSVNIQFVNPLPTALRDLYVDFCVLQDDTYSCPSSFNKLTPAWFLNCSADPNMSADSDLRFYAVRDIKLGEELTADYSTYSENEIRPAE